MGWLKSVWQSLFGSKAGDPASNFSPRAQQVLSLAGEEARRLNHNFTGTEHLLLGIIRLGNGTAVDVLRGMDLRLGEIRREIEKEASAPAKGGAAQVPHTPRVEKALALAAKESKELNHTYVGTEHILLGLLRVEDGLAAKVLKKFGLKLETTRQNVLRVLDPDYSPPPPPQQ